MMIFVSLVIGGGLACSWLGLILAGYVNENGLVQPVRSSW